MTDNDESMRVHDGYVVLSSTMGRTLVELTCPFCGETIHAYLWSLCGSGKKCQCGAVVGSRSAWRKNEVTPRRTKPKPEVGDNR